MQCIGFDENDAWALLPSNCRAPSEPEGFSERELPALCDPWRRTPWNPEVYPDYLALIAAMVDGRVEALLAGFGYWPRALRKANIEKAKAEGKAPPIMLSTMNARDDNLGRSPHTAGVACGAPLLDSGAMD
ncbi:hypothetical protein C7S16_4802 [Burkholderia thailandensis]|uniref:Uncharacterized protein n=1 Tax=Burkholderia thailandensis TaxID=57975 RepID=A0AAW9CXX6_BURTH|nr:hypothetical protein [Burkholderia thailandensis]MDW9252566.1 hypothetical protein [Burkholderia thailandensis]